MVIMDTDKIRKYADSEYDSYKIAKAMTEVKNEIKDKESGREIVVSDYFKTSQEPLLDQQRKNDKQQDQLIEQLKENQNTIVQAISYNPKQAISHDGKTLRD